MNTDELRNKGFLRLRIKRSSVRAGPGVSPLEDMIIRILISFLIFGSLNQNVDSSSKCNKWSFEEYLIRRFVTERFARAVVEPCHDFVDLLVSDL